MLIESPTGSFTREWFDPLCHLKCNKDGRSISSMLWKSFFYGTLKRCHLRFHFIASSFLILQYHAASCRSSFSSEARVSKSMLWKTLVLCSISIYLIWVLCIKEPGSYLFTSFVWKTGTYIPLQTYPYFLRNWDSVL